MACWAENGRSPLSLGCCIAGVQFQNCVSERKTLNSNADALSRRKESRPVLTAATGTQTKVVILEIQRAQQNTKVV